MTGPVIPPSPDIAGLDLTIAGGVRWRVAPVPLTGEPPVPLVFHAYKANDHAFKTEPISGIDTATGATVLLHSTNVVAYFGATDTATAAEALGGFTVSCTEIGTTGVYIVPFEADDVDTALANVADGGTVYCIIESSGDFKVAVTTIYHTARIAA